jgi:hypothetical protein
MLMDNKCEFLQICSRGELPYSSSPIVKICEALGVGV